ncbi:hypothetical protein EFK50_02310 [Nocardioides marmoriginsengisoli]|uniref:Uncharacterized protein n=1 Tax=Nocardioides marmoriginsengisoli TaxID=661483 RepID=A0A3N0CMZ5_9ACTN|nr:hypothetical protein EFK50_02310 [Nocardioides marmoriginsengisoli]
MVSGQIDTVRLHFESPTGGCRFDLAGDPAGTVPGTLPATFDESTQKLAIKEGGFAGNLYVSGVWGCLGQVQNGNPADIVGFATPAGPILPATFSVSVPGGPINLVSSP